MASSPSETLRSRIALQKERLERYKGSQPGGSVSFGSGSEHDISPDGSYEEVPSLTASELYKREMDTKGRIRTNWEALIEKISKYGEDEQGDVLDINTLEVVVDKGHLKSLAEKPNSHIWHEDYDDLREEKNRSFQRRLNRAALLKLAREVPERDDLMLVDNRPTSSERLRSRVFQKQHNELLGQRGKTPEPDQNGRFNIPQTPRTKLLTSGIDALSIVSPSINNTPERDKNHQQTQSRAAILRRLLIQRAKSRASTPASSNLQSQLNENKIEVPIKEIVLVPEEKDHSPKEDPYLNVPLMRKHDFDSETVEEKAAKAKIAASAQKSASRDSILRDIVSKVGGMSISEGKQISSLDLLRKLKHNERRLSNLIDKYEDEDDIIQTPQPEPTTPKETNSTKDINTNLPLISLLSDESENELTGTDNVEFIRPPLVPNPHYFQQLPEPVKNLEDEESLDDSDSFFSVSDDEQRGDEIELKEIDATNTKKFETRESKLENDQKQYTTTNDIDHDSQLHEVSILGTVENPITLDDDSDSASVYEDATQSLTNKNELEKLVKPDSYSSTMTHPQNLSTNHVAKTTTEDDSVSLATPPISNSTKEAPVFLKPRGIAHHASTGSDESLDNILKLLSRVDSPQKKRFATPRRKTSDSGSIISTPTSSGRKKLSPLRFNLSPLNSKKRQSSSIIPDSPLRKKPSPIKLERRNSVLLMDELSTFEDSD